jgi:hypothetical protein
MFLKKIHEENHEFCVIAGRDFLFHDPSVRGGRSNHTEPESFSGEVAYGRCNKKAGHLTRQPGFLLII